MSNKNSSRSKAKQEAAEVEEMKEPKGILKDTQGLQAPGDGQNLNEKEKLIEQNIKLKTQIYDLSTQLDKIMGKDQTRKKKYGINQDDDDQLTKAKKLELKKQQLEVLSLKNRIHSIKRQLQTVHNNRNLLAKEDELKYLRTELQNLEEQKKSLLKIKKEQGKALKSMKTEEEYEDRIEELKKQLHAVKEESKVLNEKLVESERILRKNHEQFIVKQNKVKQLEQKVHLAQKKAKSRKPIQNITPEMLSQLEDQISELEGQRKEVERTWHEKINAIDTELREKKAEEEKKLMLLKEKEKELKLNELKIKQLRRLIKHNLAESESQVKPLQVDMQQFRHKRNIKYMRDDKNGHS